MDDTRIEVITGQAKPYMNFINFMNTASAPALTVSLYESIRMLEEAGNRVVRHGIRKNLVTFPSEVPVFKKTTRPDLQAKFAVLYFIRGWSASQIGERYGLGRQRVTQILTKWRLRAVRQGYIQLIDEATVVPASFIHDLVSDSQRPAVSGEPGRILDPGIIRDSQAPSERTVHTNMASRIMEQMSSMMLG